MGEILTTPLGARGSRIHLLAHIAWPTPQSMVRISELRVGGFRSVRDMTLPLGGLNVITGPTGSGKSNLYRAIQLLSAAARGDLSRLLVADGGMPSAIWAGPQKQAREPKRIRLGVTLALGNSSKSGGLSSKSEEPDRQLAYDIQLGILPESPYDRFYLDPRVRTEILTVSSSQGIKGAPVVLMKRDGARTMIRYGDGTRKELDQDFDATETALSQISDPGTAPEIWRMARELSRWRFYHQFRTDADSPLRFPQPATKTHVLASDGSDLAPALATMEDLGNGGLLHNLLEKHFDGARLALPGDGTGSRMTISLENDDLTRPLQAAELSDGTLRFLAFGAALLTPRPPSFLVLNEPENSLNSNLIEPLSEMITAASLRSQLWVTTHSMELVQCLQDKCPGYHLIPLEKVKGETRIEGHNPYCFRDPEDEDEDDEE